MPPRTYLDQESLYLVLKKDHEHYQADAHELIEDRARKLHVEYLGRHHPDHDEEQHAVEKADGAGAFHQLVDIEEYRAYDKDIDKVFYSEGYHDIPLNGSNYSMSTS